MAGIGFVLRKLNRQDNLMGTIQAYVVSALVSSGPWLFTILALGSITAISSRFVSTGVLSDFRLIIIYNFSFSLVLTSPLFMIVTRYLADRLYEQDVSETPGLLVGGLITVCSVNLPIAGLFYLGRSTIPYGLAMVAIINFLLISVIWLISVFLTALKNYKSVTWAFGSGMFLTTICAIFLSDLFGAAGILTSFNIGFALIIAMLISRVLSEYPYAFKNPFGFLRYFYKYWEVALSGLVYNVAIWADKWVMWFAPEAKTGIGGLLSYPDYDSAMFLAYLTVIPSMAMFVLNVETDFYEKNLRFYREIQHGATYRQIHSAWHALFNSVMRSARGFLVMQASICVIIILTSVKIFDLLTINYTQLGIFRFGVLGTMFQVFSLFLIILLSYFDARKATLGIQIFFLLTNTTFAIVTLNFGFKYYGYGYFLASLSTFIVAVLVAVNYMNKLIYHTFVTQNSSVL